MLQTMPNERSAVLLWIENSLELPRCCPVSKNPQPGSRLFIRYRVRERVLEVYSLHTYIKSFVGGHEDGTRNMESMLQKIAQDCADALDTPVTVRAELELMPYQHMRVVCAARPNDVLSRDASSLLAGSDDGAAVRFASPPAGLPEAARGDL